MEPVPNSVSPLMKVILKAGEFVKWVHVENDKNFAKNPREIFSSSLDLFFSMCTKLHSSAVVSTTSSVQMKQS